MNLRQIGVAFATLVAGHVAAKVLALASMIFIGRSLASADVALFGISTTLFGYAVALGNWGTDALGIREAARNPDSQTSLARRITTLRLQIGGAIALVGFFIALTCKVPAPTALPLTLGVIVFAFRRDWLLLGLGRTRSVATSLIIREASFLGLILLVGMWSRNGVLILWCFLVAELIWSVISALMSRAEQAQGNEIRSASRPSLIREGWPIALVSLLALTNNKIDVPLIALFRTSDEVATYWASYNVVIAAAVFPSLLARAAFPEMARATSHSEEKGRTDTLRLSVAAGAAGCVVATLVWSLAAEILRLAYGGKYVDGEWALRVLALSIPAVFTYHILLSRLVSEGRQQHWAVAAGIAAILNVLTNILLLPRIGIVGAAVATVVSEWALMLSIGWAFLGREAMPYLVFAAVGVPASMAVGVLVKQGSAWATTEGAAAIAGGTALVTLALSFQLCRRLLRAGTSLRRGAEVG